jgi:hypothetical protein
MSFRAALRGLALTSVGALAVVAVATALTPGLRRRALALTGRGSAEIEPEQPTHIVLPDRAIAQWDGLAEAIEEGREAASGVAMAGA